MINVQVMQVPFSGANWHGKVEGSSVPSFVSALLSGICHGLDIDQDCEIVLHLEDGPVFASSDFREEFKAALNHLRHHPSRKS